MLDDATQAPAAEPRRRPGGRTRERTERITAATLELLVEEGYAAVTFADVADRAGVGRTTMYRRWPSPAHLVVDVVRRAAADEIRIVDRGSFHEDMVDVLTQIGAFIQSPVGRAALAAGLEAPRGSSMPIATSWAHRWSEVEGMFERAIARGELPDGIDAEALFARAAGALYFRMLVMGETNDRTWIERVLTGLLASDEAEGR